MPARQAENAAPSDSLPELVWNDDDPLASNYAKVAVGLVACEDLFRLPGYGRGVVLKLSHGKQAEITRGSDLAPILVDRLNVRVVKDGKNKGGRIAQGHLNSMLKAEAFLRHFREVDLITRNPIYLPDFTLTKPGFTDGGPGHRIIYDGDEPAVADSPDAINKFLDVMAFDSEADRANTVAAALTVMLRNHWPGGKPILAVTATKSHAGKDTVIAFAAGIDGSVSISYQSTDWALERSFVGAIDHCPEAGLIVVENARLGRRDPFIASAFIERFATDPEPLLYSTGGVHPVRRPNHLLVAISTNFGTVSEDIMNRSLPIHLRPEGDLAERTSLIGNPKLEYLPENRERIAEELRGLIERWKTAGRPLDEEVRHPFTVWGKTVGGILKANGFRGFLANYGLRRSSDDPLRKGLGLLGAAKPGEWFGPGDWARFTSDLGLVKEVIPPRDQDSPAGRQRGIGVVLSSHAGEIFYVNSDFRNLTMRLEKQRGRFNGSQPQVRYRFDLIHEQQIPEETNEAGESLPADPPSPKLKSEEFDQLVPTTEPSKAGPGVISDKGRDGSETPRWLFDLLDGLAEEVTGHRFEVDMAASSWNAKCDNYFTEEDDALKQDWSRFRTLWVNPPFAKTLIEKFIAKAIVTAEQGSTVVLLLPMWPGVEGYQDLKQRGQMRDVVGPVSFRQFGGGHAVLNNGRHSDSLVVALLGPNFPPGTNGPAIRKPRVLKPSSEGP